jgi:hypothetical protein
VRDDGRRPISLHLKGSCMGDRDGECTDIASPPPAACMRDISVRA